MALKQHKEEEIHVLTVAFASQGHINPMLRLGKHLASKGLHVSLATTEVGRHRMLKSATTTTTTTSTTISTNNSNSNEIPLLFFSDGLSLDFDRKANLDLYMETIGKAGPINLSNLIKDYYFQNGRKLSCIINNPFVPWVSDVAIELGIPCAMLWIQPCSLFAIYYRFYNNLNQFPTLTDPNMSVELAGLPLLLTPDLPSFVLPSNPFGSFPKLFSFMFQNLKSYKWVLGNSFSELEKDAIESLADICPIKPIGPLVPTFLLGEDQTLADVGVDMWKSDETCIDWLNNQAPNSVIYVSFGSILVLSAEQMEAIATALKNINRPFIWVVRGPESPSPNGEGQVPQGFIEEIKNQGLIVSWSPQAKVLAHQAIACFITHCGWNSLLESITAGVPVIAYPQWTDQPTNAKLITDVFRIGLRLRPSQDGIVTNDEMEKCVREIMDGKKSEFKRNAAELKAAARKAVAYGGSSDRNIQLFVDEVVSSMDAR